MHAEQMSVVVWSAAAAAAADDDDDGAGTRPVKNAFIPSRHHTTAVLWALCWCMI